MSEPCVPTKSDFSLPPTDNDNEQDQPPEWNVLLTKDGPRPPTNEDEGRFPLYDPYYLTTDSIENCRKVDDVEPLWYSPDHWQIVPQPTFASGRICQSIKPPLDPMQWTHGLRQIFCPPKQEDTRLFQPFSRLPKELRLQIWKDAHPPSRIYNTERDLKPTNHEILKWYQHLHTCFESRSTFLSHYHEARPVRQEGSPPLYVDYSQDTFILFVNHMVESHAEVQTMIGVDLSRMQNIAFYSEDLNLTNVRNINGSIRRFTEKRLPAIKSLTLLVGWSYGTDRNSFDSRFMKVGLDMIDFETSYISEAFSPVTQRSEYFQTAIKEKQNFVVDYDRWRKSIQFDVSLLCFDESQNIVKGEVLFVVPKPGNHLPSKFNEAHFMVKPVECDEPRIVRLAPFLNCVDAILIRNDVVDSIYDGIGELFREENDLNDDGNIHSCDKCPIGGQPVSVFTPEIFACASCNYTWTLKPPQHRPCHCPRIS